MYFLLLFMHVCVSRQLVEANLTLGFTDLTVVDAIAIALPTLDRGSFLASMNLWFVALTLRPLTSVMDGTEICFPRPCYRGIYMARMHIISSFYHR
jgi:hypothetical protein